MRQHVFPFSRRDTSAELIRVKARRRDHRYQLAAFDIHDNGRPAMAIHAFGQKGLQVGANGKVQVIARLPGPCPQFANGASMRINLNMTHARFATQSLFIFALNAAPPDNIADNIADASEVFCRLGSDIADQMRAGLFLRINPLIGLFRLNARKKGDVEIELGKVFPRQIIDRHQRFKLCRASNTPL